MSKEETNRDPELGLSSEIPIKPGQCELCHQHTFWLYWAGSTGYCNKCSAKVEAEKVRRHDAESEIRKQEEAEKVRRHDAEKEKMKQEEAEKERRHDAEREKIKKEEAEKERCHEKEKMTQQKEIEPAKAEQERAKADQERAKAEQQRSMLELVRALSLLENEKLILIGKTAGKLNPSVSEGADESKRMQNGKHAP